MTALFPETSRPKLEEIETFNSLLDPIIRHVETFVISDSQRPSVIFSLLPANIPAQNASEKLQLNNISL